MLDASARNCTSNLPVGLKVLYSDMSNCVRRGIVRLLLPEFYKTVRLAKADGLVKLWQEQPHYSPPHAVRHVAIQNFQADREIGRAVPRGGIQHLQPYLVLAAQ